MLELVEQKASLHSVSKRINPTTAKKPIYQQKHNKSEDTLSNSLIDSMNLVYEDHNGETFEDLFKPSKIPNPHFQRLYQVRS